MKFGAKFNSYFSFLKKVFKLALIIPLSHLYIQVRFSMKLDKLEIQILNEWPYRKKNYILFAIGLLLIIIGYLVMAAGEVNSFQSLTLAPIMLFTGYIVIIPLALFWKDKKN
tara:strand:- start:227 stop:562 length:336 start_codon:yes stop_codon:yes gene_type:complete